MAIQLPLQELEIVDPALGLPVAPLEREAGSDGRPIVRQAPANPRNSAIPLALACVIWASKRGLRQRTRQHHQICARAPSKLGPQH